MAVKLRLRRAGAKKFPFYHIVAVDSREKRDGAYLELLGSYNPLTKPEEVKLDEEKITKWLKTGATPTDTVRVLISKAGILKKFHDEKTPKTKKVSKRVTKKEPAKKVEVKIEKATTTKKAEPKVKKATITKKVTAKKNTKKVGK